MRGQFEPQDEPSEASPEKEEISLTGRQFMLEAALRERSEELADMFLGAVVVLGQKANPERWVHAAHSVREVMQRIYDIFEPEVGIPKAGATLGDKVNVLVDRWKKNEADFREGEAITRQLAKFLADFEEFVVWRAAARPTQKDRAAKVLDALDPSRSKLPVTVQASRVEEWHDCYDFFVSVLHHKRKWTQDEFSRWLEYFEQLMASHLRPQTYETYAAIDGLIAKAESDAR